MRKTWGTTYRLSRLSDFRQQPHEGLNQAENNAATHLVSTTKGNSHENEEAMQISWLRLWTRQDSSRVARRREQQREQVIWQSKCFRAQISSIFCQHTVQWAYTYWYFTWEEGGCDKAENKSKTIRGFCPKHFCNRFAGQTILKLCFLTGSSLLSIPVCHLALLSLVDLR
jgi:hypothetical protein